MSVRAVVLPATPLLVPGAAGAGEVLPHVRAAVREALDRLLADLPGRSDGDAPLVVVLAPGARDGARPAGRAATAAGRLRPSLAGAGIADRWVPGLARWPDGDTDGVAHVPASVALLCLDDALRAADGTPAVGPVVVRTLELAPDLGPDEAAAVAARLQAAAGVVVADGGAPPGEDRGAGVVAEPVTARVLGRCARARGWAPEARDVPAGGDHLAPAYRVTVYREGAGRGGADRRPRRTVAAC